MKSNKNGYYIIFLLCLAAGMLFGRMIQNKWNQDVDDRVEKIVNRVVMIDVPPIDVAVAEYLELGPNYPFKYLTAIDVADGDYGIYEIGNNDEVKAYAHGKCVSVGSAEPGLYEIAGTKSHVDYHDVRYWRVVDLVSLDDINQEKILTVSSSGYEIDDAPIVKKDSVGFGNVMIDSEVMLTVYDNSEPGIILIVIDSKEEEKNGNPR